MSKIYLLNNQKYEGVENIEVFNIEFISSKIDLKEYDFLIITSKNAIYSLDSFNNEWKNIPCLAIAKKTAKVIEKEGGIVSFIGESSHGNDFAKEILPHLKNKKAIYIRANDVVSSLVEILKENNVDIDELVTYKTVCNNFLNTKIEDCSTIIFTSPSSVKCFFEKYTWNETFKAVVIGKTTAKYIPEGISFKVSPITSIEECIKLAKMVTF